MTESTTSGSRRLETPWAFSSDETLERIGSHPDGLSEETARQRLAEWGSNRLKAPERRGTARILLDQIKSLFVLLLGAASGVSLVYGEWLQGIAIAAAIVVNAALGFIVEWRATRSMESLQKLGGVRAKVRRGGEICTIDAEDVVPGDVLHLDAGDLVTADARLLEASKLQVDESTLTGESSPVSKRIDPVDRDAPLAERTDMVYRGTTVTRGSGEAVAVATGMSTELGEVSTLVEQAGHEETPLDQRLRRLGRRLIWLTLVVAAAVGASGLLAGRDLLLMVETSIALAVAAIPEGLPIVTNMALARGMWRMARRNAWINRLSAVETLGTVTMILSDKTGTLTENRMTVRRIVVDGGDHSIGDEDSTPDVVPEGEASELLRLAVLCNNASLGDPEDPEEGIGDPLEVALLHAGRWAGHDRPALLKQHEEVREVSFDPDVRMMATFHRTPDGFLVAVKGAPDAVLEASTSVLTADGPDTLRDNDRNDWSERADRLAGDGLRVLAVARRRVSRREEEPYEELTLIGLVGMEDPARKGVASSIDQCVEAGIRVVMMTGDHAPTAVHIAREVGLVEEEDPDVIEGREVAEPSELSEERRRRVLACRVFARVSPRQKLALIELFQDSTLTAFRGFHRPQCEGNRVFG